MVQAQRICLTLLVLVAGGTFSAAGESPLSLQDLTARRWGKEEGLPHSDVTAVLQTRDGYLWVGTPGGLARFDGVRFEPIGPPAGRANEVLCVTALCEDAAGRLWIGSRGGGLLSYVDGVVQRIANGAGWRELTVTSIAADKTGDLWVGTPAGLARFAGGRGTLFVTTQDGLPSDFVTSVHVARSGTIWITTRGGLCQFRAGRILPLEFQTGSPARSPEFIGVYEDRQGILWAFGDTYLVNLGEGKRFNYFGGGGPASERIWSLCEGRDGRLWIGTSGQGLFSFAGGRFQPLALREGRLSSDVRAICEDREGNLWLGTFGGGLVRLRPRTGRLLVPSAGLPGGPATCAAFDGAGRIWVGYEHGGLYASAADRFERPAGDGGGGPQNLVSTICVAPDRSVWVGTLGAGLWRGQDQTWVQWGTADGLPDDDVLAVAVEADGTLWASTRAGGLVRLVAGGLTRWLPLMAGLPSSAIGAILPARAGGLWLGTANGEILRGQGGRFHRVQGTEACAGKAVRALHEDGAGRLWIGTAGGGLVGHTPGESWHWDTQSGFPDDWVQGILGDDEGNLWLGTAKGVYRLARADLLAPGKAAPPARLLFESDVPVGTTSGCGWPGAARSAAGRLCFTTGDGVVSFDPHGVEPGRLAPPVYIEAVWVNAQPLPNAVRRRAGELPPGPGTRAPTPPAPVPVRLPSNLRSLEIQFTALDLTAPEKIRFQHKLEGFEADWVEGGTERRVRYGRLPYGQFVFRVKADNARGTELAFAFPAPVWQAPAALMLYACTAAALVAGAVRWVSYRRLRTRLARLAQQQAMQKERMRIAQDMHDEIGSKLTKISFLSERAKGELQAQHPVAGKLDAIALTSRDLLQSLDEIVWAVNPHNDTLEHLAAYLGHYATEYLQNTAVECELRLPRGLPHHPLSAEVRHNLFLAFEEALNNTLKHSGATRVRVAMVAAPRSFEITVADNGHGFSPDQPRPKKRGGNGLTNMRQRLAEVNGQCSLHSQMGQGTTVSLRIPLAPAQETIS